MKQLWGLILILLLAGFCLSAQAEEEHEHFIHYQGYDADAHYARCQKFSATRKFRLHFSCTPIPAWKRR